MKTLMNELVIEDTIMKGPLMHVLLYMGIGGENIKYLDEKIGWTMYYGLEGEKQ